MKTSSAKQKGKRLVVKTKEMLLEMAPDLVSDDIMVPASSSPGDDLKLSPAAQKVYPLVFEMKNTEKINVWAAYAQACTHVKDDRKPVVVYAKNNTEPMITLKLAHFLWLIR